MIRLSATARLSREKGAAGFSPAAPKYMDQRSDIRCRKLLRAGRPASLNF